MMEKKILSLAIIAMISTISCKEKSGETNAVISTKEVTPANKETMSVATNETGEKLTMIFDIAKESAKVIWKQDTILLKEQISASGFWYKNDEFELRGKGEKVEFSKAGKSIFKN